MSVATGTTELRDAAFSEESLVAQDVAIRTLALSGRFGGGA
jgi:hypothetical protein